MKTEQQEIGGTVQQNEKMVVVIVCTDGRMYRHTYHKNSAYLNLVPGDVVKVYYAELTHGDLKVYGMDLERALPMDDDSSESSLPSDP